MKRLFGFILLLCSLSLSAQEYSWEYEVMDGSRKSALEKGEIKLKKKSVTAKTIALVDAAQPAMARVKEVIGYSTEALSKSYPQSKLSNWAVDTVIEKVESISGKKVDIGFANFGGIRVDMPKGNIVLDDILSMFPFKNNLVYLEHKGSTLRAIFEWMPQSRMLAAGGAQLVIEDGKLVSVLVGGEPLDDDKVYSVATNTFLLYGGDGVFLAKDALVMKIYDDVLLDAMLESIRKYTAEGRPFEYKLDSRVIMK